MRLPVVLVLWQSQSRLQTLSCRPLTEYIPVRRLPWTSLEISLRDEEQVDNELRDAYPYER